MQTSLGKQKNAVAADVINRLRQCLPAGPEPIALHSPTFGGNEWTYVKECLDTGWVSSVGSYVDRFERDLATYVGTKHCVAAVNGTAALHMAQLIAGVEPGDEVLVPDLTFAATANAVTFANATPHLVDVSFDTLGVDAAALAEWLKQVAETRGKVTVNKQTGAPIRALIVMHTFGHPSDIDGLLDVCERYNIVLIEDAAESIGSYYKGKHTGRFGRVATLSFNGNKIITTGGGGAIVTDDAELAKKAKHLTTTAKLPHKWRFQHDTIGYNYRLPNLNAALGVAQLEQLDGLLARKRKLTDEYIAAFADFESAYLFREPKDCHSNYWLNALVFDDKSGETLEHLLEETNESGLQTRPAWDLIHTLPAFKDVPKAPVPQATELRERLLCIPSSPHLKSLT